MNRTPAKYSTPPSAKSNFSKDTEPTTPSKSPNSNHYYSVLRMISNFIFNTDAEHLTDSKRKGSWLVQRSPSTASEGCIIEDRFIPSRRLINDFDMNDK
jgi:hypothetical protein